MCIRDRTVAKGKTDLALFLNDNTVCMFDQPANILEQLAVKYIHADEILVFLVLSHHLFDQLLVDPHEPEQPVLKTGHAEHAIDQLVVAVLVGGGPGGGRFVFGVDRGGGDSCWEEVGDEVVEEGDVFGEVLVYFDEIIYLLVDVAHQEVQVEVVLSS